MCYSRDFSARSERTASPLAPSCSLGAVYAVINVAQFSYRMSLIPDALQGRISSIIRLLVYGSLPVGLASRRILHRARGRGATVVALGAGLVKVALAAQSQPTDSRRA